MRLLSSREGPAATAPPVIALACAALITYGYWLGTGSETTATLPLAITVLVPAAAAIAVRPIIGLVLIAAVAAFDRSIATPFGELGASELLSLLLAPIAVLTAVASSRHRLILPRLVWPLLALWLAYAVSIAQAVDPARAVPFVFKYVCFTAVLIASVNVCAFYDLRRVEFVVGAFLFVQLFLASAQILLFLRLGQGALHTGPFALHKNAVGLYMALALSAILAQVLFGGRPRLLRWYGTAGALVVVALVLSGSRGGWVAATVGCVSLACLKSRTSALRTVLAALLLVSAGIALLPESLTRANEIVVLAGSAENRLYLWQLALAQIQRNPFVGIGAGSFVRTWGVDPHNFFLTVWVELGLFGFASFVALVVTFFGEALSIFNTSQTPRVRALVASVIGAWVTYLAASFFGPSFQRGHGTLMFLFAGVLAALPLVSADKSRPGD